MHPHPSRPSSPAPGAPSTLLPARSTPPSRPPSQGRWPGVARALLPALACWLGVVVVEMGAAGAEAAGGAPGPDSAAAPLQGAALLKADLLGVFAHPDDETGVASTMAHYALGRGRAVAHVYITRGEGGGNMVGTQSGAALGLLREAELRQCLAGLGVRQCVFLDQLDWAYTESLAATLRKWGHEETLGRLVRVVRALRPEVIVTMNPAPNPGQHGHHQAAGLLAIEAFAAAADPARFPEHLRREGLAPWQVRKVYISGGGSNATTRIDVSAPLPDGRTPGQVAAQALANHRSQAFGRFDGAGWLARPQSFTLVRSALGPAAGETDLLAGLPPPGAAVAAAIPGGPLEFAPGSALAFVPRPAVARFQEWAAAQGPGVRQLAAAFRADVPLLAGQPNDVWLRIGSRVPSTALPGLRVSGPAGWRVEGPVRIEADRRSPAGGFTALVRATPPAGRPADGELRAELGWDGRTESARALAHPVPVARVPRLRRAPAMDGSGAGWESVPALRVTPTDLAQGKSAGDADSSAVFRLAHDGRRLWVDVEVLDDHVVSNIASNDIQGHWRSDSVEICVDPAAGSEDTLGSYKLGIFPFDATGVVRAARDADARPGRAEETAPGTRLVSVRTPGGYRVQVTIPLAEIGSDLERGRARGRRLGFNLIVYDGDKADAAPGENINKSRIAWSPRPGVQGRPEDWGRIELE